MAKRTEFLACAECGYDLGPQAGEAGVCPECGLEFHKPSMRASNTRAVRLGLVMLGWGALAAFAIELSGRMISSSVEIAKFSILPELVAWGGVGVVGWRTGRTTMERWWPGALGVASGILALFGWACLIFPKDHFATRWPQPQSAYEVTIYFEMVLYWSMLAVGFWVIRRISRGGGAGRMRRCAVALSVLALLGLACTLIRYVTPDGISAAGAGAQDWYAAANSLGMLQFFFILCVQASLGGLALLARTSVPRGERLAMGDGVEDGGSRGR